MENAAIYLMAGAIILVIWTFSRRGNPRNSDHQGCTGIFFISVGLIEWARMANMLSVTGVRLVGLLILFAYVVSFLHFWRRAKRKPTPSA